MLSVRLTETRTSLALATRLLRHCCQLWSCQLQPGLCRSCCVVFRAVFSRCVSIWLVFGLLFSCAVSALKTPCKLWDPKAKTNDGFWGRENKGQFLEENWRDPKRGHGGIGIGKANRLEEQGKRSREENHVVTRQDRAAYLQLLKQDHRIFGANEAGNRSMQAACQPHAPRTQKRPKTFGRFPLAFRWKRA